MKRQTTLLFVVAMIFSLSGVLCFVAGAPRYGFLSRRVGNFSGIALVMVGAGLWAAYGISAGSGRRE